MKKILLVPALMMFAAAPALAQTSPSSTINSDMGREASQIEGAKESQMGRDATAAKPTAPSQIENSESQRTGATPTNENQDEIKKPVR
ncbi:hypothetical protein [Terrihabitans rhizophilus]|uniref:Uncharacterized protein n=1 Tax=Terrihabitans rhizophilus TaxID=3092662 RepID=A0ABU4RR13_9HYPH|nr:hypothetical protein [Terrihabitans sp. PJ23]MDX6805216.1 hypothetical protein [Terrihabitans sp. PJ23]